MNDDWVDLTDVFQPGEYVQDALNTLRAVRIFSVDNEAAIVFLSSHMAIEHAAVRIASKQWTCPCAEAYPCFAVAMLQLRDYAANLLEHHRKYRE